jgi:formylglycine-generating enzyme required for sulfatase activity
MTFRKIIFLTFFVLLKIAITAQPEVNPKFLKQLNLVPIGIANTYMFKYEVSNLNYIEMMFFAQKKDPDLYQEMLPDTLSWRNPLGYNEKFVEYYFRHWAFKNYPVVGVSHDQAIQYCALLTEFLNKNIIINSKEIEEVVVRLPTEFEWETAARAGNPFKVYPWKGETIRNEKSGIFQGNFVVGFGDQITNSGALNDGMDITTPHDAYYPNDFGIYNLGGNVAEMLAESGLSKGGSWFHGPVQCRIDSLIHYSYPESWLGFRYVVEIVKYRNKEVRSTPINAKIIDKNLVFMDSTLHQKSYNMGGEIVNITPPSFYLSSIETPNSWYNLFLDEIKQTSLDDYNRCVPDKNLWDSTTTILNYKEYVNQDHFQDFPVVNISKDAAKLFCEWLSNKYNQDANRKFQKVSFSLPTLKEWQFIATVLLEDFYTYSFKKGQIKYLANVHPSDINYFSRVALEDKRYKSFYDYPKEKPFISRGLDGYEMLCPVNCFKMESTNFYNLYGNAAEMVADDEVAYGGSWRTHIESLHPNLNYNYIYPSPEVGFRIVMRVIEE